MSDRLRVLVAASDGDAADWLRAALGDGYDVGRATRPESVMSSLEVGRTDAVVLGAGTTEMLARIRESDGPRATVLLLDAGDEDPGPDIYYVLDRRMDAEHVRRVVDASAGRRIAPPPAPAAIGSRDEAASVQRIIELTRPLALQKDLPGAAAVATGAVEALIDVDRAYCLFHDADDGSLWSEGDGEVQTTAARGIVGFAARTGLPATADYARDDPRYCGAVDDPRGGGSERLLVQPIAGGDGQVHAVLVAARAPASPAFSDADVARVRSLADHAGPLMHQLALQLHASSILEEGVSEGALFRREAVEAMANEGKRGDVIRVSPVWVSWAYWLVLALFLAAAGYAVLGRINKYSAGPAVVRVSGRTEVNANLAGAVTDLYVASGQSVKPGELLARFYDAEEAANVDRTRREFQRQLRNRMLNRGDEAAAAAVQALRERRDEAEARLREREVRAPHAGTVSDLRVRVGQQVAPGDTILSLVTDDTELSVLAFLPGGDRPRLSAGMPMRLELHNYRYAYQHVTVDAVDAEVIGPQEAQRYLGPKLEDVVSISGPVVLVRARLPSTTFEADGVEYRYYDGMSATAEVRVDSERIIEAIIPGLKRLK